MDLNELATPGIYRVSAGAPPRTFETVFRGYTKIQFKGGRPFARTWWEHEDGKLVAIWKKFGDREWIREPTKAQVLFEYWAAALERLGSSK
jgi:hypothetical protein